MRDGYQSNFLGSNFTIGLPEPELTLMDDVLQPPGLPEGETVIPYIHYSLLMSKSTRQALYSAANVDLNRMQTVPSRQGRKWFYDGRVGKDNQVTNSIYTHSPWDRGHLTRRTAVTWGESKAFAISASNDSCSYTNASLQHENFNEDEWRAVEGLVAKFKLASQLTVMTGPVFTTTDRFYTREFGDKPVRIPSAFWKIINYVDPQGELSTQAYIFFQDVPSIRTERARARISLKNLQVTTTEVALWTGLRFDQKLYDSNPLKFYSGPESISTKQHKALLEKEPATLSLNAGITNDTSIQAARSAFPIEDFYALIEEVSWV